MRKHSTFIIASFFLFVLAMAGFFAYRAYFTPEALSRREVAKWIGIIGDRVELPQGEVPTLARVANQGKLQGQEFFEGAENGDIALIYPRSGWAVLYRPSTGRVLEITTDVKIEKE